jgi:DNA-3-methyladenine glycosylase II
VTRSKLRLHDEPATNNTRGNTLVTTTTVPDVMLDHPSWLAAADGTTYRSVRSGESVWSVTCSPVTDTSRRVCLTLVAGVGAAPAIDVVYPASLASQAPLAGALNNAGPVARMRNPDLWDALATSIVRQVIRAGHARKLYRAFCRDHGESVETTAGTTWLFPLPQAILALTDQEFARSGMAFKRRPLRAAAQAYTRLGDRWRELPPAEVLTEMQTVSRIGPWTAGAAVADASNDFRLYPFADLAVRTWAKRLDPARQWPDNESEFARVWRRLAGEQLSALTLLTLAWGVRHANAGVI